MLKLGIHANRSTNCIPGAEGSNSAQSASDSSRLSPEVASAMVCTVRARSFGTRRMASAPARGKAVIRVRSDIDILLGCREPGQEHRGHHRHGYRDVKQVVLDHAGLEAARDAAHAARGRAEGING